MPLSRGRLITIAVIVVVVLGLVFLRGPTPHIAIKPETLTSLGGAPQAESLRLLCDWGRTLDCNDRL